MNRRTNYPNIHLHPHPSTFHACLADTTLTMYSLYSNEQTSCISRRVEKRTVWYLKARIFFVEGMEFDGEVLLFFWFLCKHNIITLCWVQLCVRMVFASPRTIKLSVYKYYGNILGYFIYFF